MGRKSILESTESHQPRSRAVAPEILRAKPRTNPATLAAVSKISSIQAGIG